MLLSRGNVVGLNGAIPWCGFVEHLLPLPSLPHLVTEAAFCCGRAASLRCLFADGSDEENAATVFFDAGAISH